MRLYLNNTRIFSDYAANPHHHLLMLSIGCMAGAYDDQIKVDIPSVGDIVALYANGVGIVAYGTASAECSSLNDDRVGGHPTRLRLLNNFRLLAYPIHHSEYRTSNTQTLQQVKHGAESLISLLESRAIPSSDMSVFSESHGCG